MEPADIYMLGHAKIGDAMRRAGLFAAAGKPFMLQNVGGAITRAMVVHMMAAAPTATFHCHNDYEVWQSDVVAERLDPINGLVRVPEKPGLGLTLDRGALERLKAARTARTRQVDHQIALQKRHPHVQHRRSGQLDFHGAARSQPPDAHELCRAY